MAAQALECLRALDKHCIENMDPALKRALILECEGKTHQEIAQIEHVSAGTVGQWIRIASSEIGLCLPLGARVAKVTRGYWVGQHLSNCLAEAAAQLDGHRG